MDRVLNYNAEIFQLITTNFDEIQNANLQIEFLIWNELPHEFEKSYYLT
jgi:hypothetical protein